MKRLNFFISGEFLFAVFLMSGAFKETFSFLPFDLTVLTLVVTLVISLSRLYKANFTLDKRPISMMVIFLCFIGLTILSILYSQSSSYAIEKTLRFICFTAWSFICPFLLINNKESISKFLSSIIVISTIASVFIVYNFYNNTAVNTSFVGLDDGNYLGSARLVGTGAIALLVVFLYKLEITKIQRFIVLIALGLNSLSIITTGARMPLIALAMTFLVLIFSTIKYKRGKIIFRNGSKRIILILVCLVPVLYSLKDSKFTHTFFLRLNVLFDGGGSSALGRIDRFSVALDMIKDSFFFGGGFGSFGLNYIGKDIREYPHNIFLEVGSELGIIGILILGSLMLMGFLKSMKNIKGGDHIDFWVFSSLVFLLTNAMVSGDLNDNRMFFAFLGIAAHSKIIFEDKLMNNDNKRKNLSFQLSENTIK